MFTALLACGLFEIGFATINEMITPCLVRPRLPSEVQSNPITLLVRTLSPSYRDWETRRIARCDSAHSELSQYQTSDGTIVHTCFTSLPHSGSISRVFFGKCTRPDRSIHTCVIKLALHDNFISENTRIKMSHINLHGMNDVIDNEIAALQTLSYSSMPSYHAPFFGFTEIPDLRTKLIKVNPDLVLPKAIITGYIKGVTLYRFIEHETRWLNGMLEMHLFEQVNRFACIMEQVYFGMIEFFYAGIIHLDTNLGNLILSRDINYIDQHSTICPKLTVIDFGLSTRVLSAEDYYPAVKMLKHHFPIRLEKEKKFQPVSVDDISGRYLGSVIDLVQSDSFWDGLQEHAETLYEHSFLKNEQLIREKKKRLWKVTPGSQSGIAGITRSFG